MSDTDFIQQDQVDMLVAGERVTADLDDDLTIAHVGHEMRTVAAQMNRWGAVWAASEAEYEQLDAMYRAWRGSMVEAILSGNPKQSEWKVKAEIDSDPGFMKHKNALAIATRNKVRCKAVFQSFETKARLLQSKGAAARMELERTGAGSYVGDDDGEDGEVEEVAPTKSAPKKKPDKSARTQRLKDRMRKKKQDTQEGEN